MRRKPTKGRTGEITRYYSQQNSASFQQLVNFENRAASSTPSMASLKILKFSVFGAKSTGKHEKPIGCDIVEKLGRLLKLEITNISVS